MSLGASVLPIFEQLGMLEELKTFALPCHTAEVYNDKTEKLGYFDMLGLDKLYVSTLHKRGSMTTMYETALEED